MAFATADSRNTQIAEMNITPLVDVMLVLLVIFMIAAPAMTKVMPLTLPGTAGKAAERQILHLTIGAGDLYTLDGVAVGRVELRQRFEQAARAASLPIVVEVIASPEAEYETVAQGLALARNAGLENLDIATH
ncbi:ExbD/TolR family protein [Arenimonas oryziterrae]|uniref:Biopolymer transporter ExbD n=1 Tax=Arenimonas oryziterrae DSM 21050 = YC6267 TaxID=1121015 RepID=A0A091AU92_9GAMM|nr:biopolymer transporter ExbD [Arenimonas oryziterrae]KFN43798.1 hypothetical protein N789_07585 [Arenimonas oryziterrae DSM 21050 = YC6267]